MQAVTQESRGLALGDYLQMMWQRRWLVVVVTVLAGILAFVTRPAVATPLHQATLTLQVQTYQITASGDAPLVESEGVPPAEVQAARALPVAAETAEELGIAGGATEVLAGISAAALEGTDLLQLTYIGEGPAAARIVQSYAENYVEFRSEQDQERLARALERIEEDLDDIRVELSDVSARLAREGANGEPTPETQTEYNAINQVYTDTVAFRERLQLEAALSGDQIEAVGTPIVQRLGAIPARTLRLIAGPAAGFLLGAALAVALGVLRPRITGRDRTEGRLGFPVLATIPQVKHRRVAQDPLLVQRLSGWGAEGVRMLRTELDLVEERVRELRIIVVVSPEPRDGKSTVAANLAASYASAGRNVALMHADLRATLKRSRFTRKSVPELTEAAPTGLPAVKHPAGFAEIYLSQARERLGGEPSKERLVKTVMDLTGDYDVVVVDTPPLLAFADALLLASEAHAVVLVTRYGKTSEDAAAEALEILARHDAPIAGIVLNGVNVGRVERYRYRRYYGAWDEVVASRTRAPESPPEGAEDSPTAPGLVERPEDAPTQWGEQEASSH